MSMFGAYAMPQQGGGMFGQPQQSSLMQMLGGGMGGGMGGGSPQLLQLAQQLAAAGGPQRMPMGGTPMPGAPAGGMFGGLAQPGQIPGMGQGQQPGLAQLLQLLAGGQR